MINIDSPIPQAANLILYKDDVAVAQGAKYLQSGNNSVYFNDVPNGGGVHTYKVVVDVDNDTPNNIAEFGVLVQGKDEFWFLVFRSVLTQLLVNLASWLKKPTPLPSRCLGQNSQFESIICNVPSLITESELQNVATAGNIQVWVCG